MAWVRGPLVGRGSFGTVNLALSMPAAVKSEDQAGVCLPGVMAVKSSPLMESLTLSHEKEVLDRLAGCPEVVACYGDEVSDEADGRRLYNVLLEYVPGGSLSELCRGKPMAEDDVRRYAASMLRGLRRVHGEGYVHCDLKPQNVLVAGPGRAKIADFGLAKRAGAKVGGSGRAGFLRGTLLYMAPESVEKGEYEPPSDVWSLGCVVSEMATGMPAWRYRGRATASAVAPLLLQIGTDEELPEIPEELSEEGREFLRRCFVRNPSERWTVEMLLGHPFVEAAAAEASESTTDGDDDGQHSRGGKLPTTARVSPKSIMGFPTGASPRPSDCSSSAATTAPEPSASGVDGHVEPAVRLRQLAVGPPESERDCSSSQHGEEDFWVTVREAAETCNWLILDEHAFGSSA